MILGEQVSDLYINKEGVLCVNIITPAGTIQGEISGFTFINQQMHYIISKKNFIK